MMNLAQLRALLLLAVVLVPLGASRAEGSIDEVQLVAAVAATDPRLAGVQASLAAARAEVTNAGRRANPSLAVEREEPFLEGAGSATNYLRITLPFEISGRRGRAVAAAELHVRAALASASRREREILDEALQVFDEAARSRLVLDVLVRARGSLARAVEIARQRQRTGDAGGYEVQRFELELARHDDEIASARIELQTARARLAMAAGSATALDASTTLDVPREVPSPEVLLASASRGDLQGARLRGEAATRRASAASRGWIPAPTLMAGAMSTEVGDRTATGYVVGLGLSLPVFDRGQSEQQLARAERAAAAADVAWLEREVPARIRDARTRLVARIDQARALGTAQLARLDVIVGAAETAFAEGHVALSELLDAHRTARAVRLRDIELRYEVARDRHALELALGHRL